MRIDCVGLLIAAAILAGPSFSEISGSNLVRFHTGHSTTDDKSGIPGNRVLQTTGAMNGEERAPGSSGITSFMKTIEREIPVLLSANSHAVSGSTFTEQVRAGLQHLDDGIVSLYAEGLKGNHVLCRMVAKMLSSGPGGVRMVEGLIQAFGRKQAAELLEKAAKGLVVPERADQHMLIRQAITDPQIAYPGPLYMLKNSVKAWNAEHSEHLTMLQFLLQAYGDVAELALDLSLATKINPDDGLAKQLQNEILMAWLDKKQSIDYVYAMLEQPESGVTGVKFENMDMLHQYIELHNEKYRGNVDIVTYLRRKSLGDIEIAQMIWDARKRSLYFIEMLKHLIRQWQIDSHSPISIAGKLLEAGIDESMVLLILVSVCHGVSHLARALSVAKMDPATKLTAKRLQTKMIMTWLPRDQPFAAVYGILKPRESSTTGIVFQNLDTLVEYAAAHNAVPSNTKIDVFAFLREKHFDDVELVRMILDLRTMSPNNAVTILERLFEQWRIEHTLPIDIAHQFLAAGFDETTVLSLLEKFCGSISSLARALSVAKIDPATKHTVDVMQSQLMLTWLPRDQPFAAVYDILKPPESSTTGLVFQNLDTLVEYAAAHNAVPSNTKIDVFAFLREKHFDDVELVRMILDLWTMSPNNAVTSLEHLVRLWQAERKSAIDIAHQFLAAGFDETTVLSLLEKFCGSISSLARVLSAAKIDPATKHTVDVMQSQLMLTWLIEGHTIDIVYNILKPSELSTTGLVFENLDTLVEYAAAHNAVPSNTKIDVFAFLREKHFDDVELVRMILDLRTMSPNNAVTILERLFEQWRIEHTLPIDIAHQFLAAGFDETTVLSLLEKFCGSISSLARALSVAKIDPATKHTVDVMQSQLMLTWLPRDQPFAAVYDILKPPESSTTGLVFQNLDTLVEYAAAHNAVPSNTKIDVFAFLREKHFDDVELVRMILDLWTMSPNNAVTSLEHLVRLWQAERKSAIDIAHQFLAAGFDETTVLSLLEKFCGSISSLARVLSAAKIDPATKHTVDVMQSQLMLTWLIEGHTIDIVYNILKPSELSTTGLVFENLDTLVEYAAAHNAVPSNTKIDVFAFLREKHFDDVELVRMILDLRTMSPNNAVTILERLFEQWRIEHTLPIDIAHQFLAAGFDETTVLSLLEKFCGSISSLARALSVAKIDPATKHTVDVMQSQLMLTWLPRDQPFAAVYDILKPPESSTTGLVFQNLDTLVEYAAAHNAVPSNTKIDVFAFLREKHFDDVELVRMILDLWTMSPNNAVTSLEHLVRLWQAERKSAIDIAHQFLAAGFDETTVLSLLEKFCGSISSLARVLSAAKIDPATKHTVDVMQSQLMLTWLIEGHTIDIVYNILKPSELSTTGLVFENLDTLVEYAAAHNAVPSNTKIDVFAFLREKHFDDVELVRMILDLRTMSPNNAVTSLEHLVRLWQAERKSAIDIAHQFLAAGYDESTVHSVLSQVYGIVAGQHRAHQQLR
ncbi:unnamed protein product [Hyaloperonospora brassicae]|uniref:RxLR effector candidate protein n=1 Tax=Hyaloperonospora brassicae TaxID=162125 RepID=A0AAV0UJ84_HYABA|nr:unnamed protein product [Hyaloperonospora brassicae]